MRIRSAALRLLFILAKLTCLNFRQSLAILSVPILFCSFALTPLVFLGSPAHAAVECESLFSSSISNDQIKDSSSQVEMRSFVETAKFSMPDQESIISLGKSIEAGRPEAIAFKNLGFSIDLTTGEMKVPSILDVRNKMKNIYDKAGVIDESRLLPVVEVLAFHPTQTVIVDETDVISLKPGQIIQRVGTFIGSLTSQQYAKLVASGRYPIGKGMHDTAGHLAVFARDPQWAGAVRKANEKWVEMNFDKEHLFPLEFINENLAIPDFNLKDEILSVVKFRPAPAQKASMKATLQFAEGLSEREFLLQANELISKYEAFFRPYGGELAYAPQREGHLRAAEAQGLRIPLQFDVALKESVYGRQNPLMLARQLKSLLAAIERGEPVRISHDQTISPERIERLARLTLARMEFALLRGLELDAVEIATELMRPKPSTDGPFMSYLAEIYNSTELE